MRWLLWIGLFLSTTSSAAPVAAARPVQVLPLKTGVLVQVELASADGPHFSIVKPDVDGRVLALECPLHAESRRDWVAFFQAVSEQQLPARVRAVPGACEAHAAYGNTPGTEKIVYVEVRPAAGGGVGPTVASSVSRRESQELAKRFAEGVDSEGSSGAFCGDGVLTAMRLVYTLKGWRRVGDPGWQADLDAMVKAADRGWLPSDVAARAIKEQKHPGTLGDVLGL